MQTPQFAERQYETAANIELARGTATPFIPTQNIEFYIGVDAVHQPRDINPIWRILSVRVPRKIMLSPALWPRLPRSFHDEIPGRFVSLFVQYKVPVYQDNRRAKYFGSMNGPYYVASITAHQRRRLQSLEQRVGSRAVVRYAAPVFWSRQDFDAYDSQRQILTHSAFVPPATVKSHRKWMFAESNRPMIFNPEPEESSGETWAEVTRLLSENARRQSLRQHIRELAELLIEGLSPGVGHEDANWIDRLRRYGEFSDDDVQLLLDLSTVALSADLAQADWVILLEPEAKWKFLADENLSPHPRLWFSPWLQ
jgi:hypothetical protein